MTQILITGAAGFIGWHLARSLAENPDHHITCVDNFIRGEEDDAYKQLCAKDNVTRIDCDLTDPAAVTALPKDADVVFHLAALNGTQNFYERPFEVMRCCTLPTIYLLEHFRGTGLKRFVFSGTSEAYASTVTQFGWQVPTDEQVPLSVDDAANVRWSYGGSKIHGEIAIHCAAQDFDIPFTVIRFHNVYGPRMGDKHVVPDFLVRAADGKYELYGFENTRAMLYVDDAIRATVDVAFADNCLGQTVNIGSAQEITMKDLGEAMMKVMGKTDPIDLHPAPAGSVLRRAPDIGKLKELVGFEETISLENGLKATADFYLDGKLAYGE